MSRHLVRLPLGLDSARLRQHLRCSSVRALKLDQSKPDNDRSVHREDDCRMLQASLCQVIARRDCRHPSREALRRLFLTLGRHYGRKQEWVKLYSACPVTDRSVCPTTQPRHQHCGCSVPAAFGHSTARHRMPSPYRQRRLSGKQEALPDPLSFRHRGRSSLFRQGATGLPPCAKTRRAAATRVNTSCVDRVGNCSCRAR